MRGGVTVKAQDLQRLNPDVIREISEMHPLLTKKLTNTTLRYAVKYYCSNWYSKMAMIRKYGNQETETTSNACSVTIFNNIIYKISNNPSASGNAR